MYKQQCRTCRVFVYPGAISCPYCRTRLEADMVPVGGGPPVRPQAAIGTMASMKHERDGDIEAARRHIAEALQFSSETGGSDELVKAWLFDLSPQELAPVMREYGQRYGLVRREYAEVTLPAWKSGRVQMSGMVAKRFFGMLPARMPLDQKYKIADRLWKHVGPSSEFRLRVGVDTPTDDVLSALRDHVEAKVAAYSIPKRFKQDFDWLAGGDIAAKEDILNRLRADEAAQVVEAVTEQFHVLRNRSVDRNGLYLRSWRQEARVGKHRIVIEFDRSADGVASDEEPYPRVRDPVEPARSAGRNAEPDRRIGPTAGRPTEKQGSGRWLWIATAAMALLAGGAGLAVALAQLD